MQFATRLYEAFKDEPEKAKVLLEFAEAVERSFEIFPKLATKDDVEKTKLELEYQIKKIQFRIKVLEGKFEARFKEIEGKIETTKKELEGKIEVVRSELELKIEKTKSSLLKWSFLFWLTQMATLFGIFFTILRSLNR
ncbi:MAG: hypothetical protein ACK4UJ_11975 [Leptonema sp. (in: bacteria)]